MTRTMPRSPAFCPSCRKGFASAGPHGLCDECGARLVDRGYCPVCEGFANAEVGDPCPKHDVPLEDGPQAVAPRADVRGPWVEVGRFRDAMDCQPPRIRLEAEGIPTAVDGERVGSQSMHPAFAGGVVLRVPESLAGDARVILSQKWSDDAEALGIEDDDWDEADEDFGVPEEGGPSLRQTSPFFYKIALIGACGAAIWLALNALALIGFAMKAFGR